MYVCLPSPFSSSLPSVFSVHFTFDNYTSTLAFPDILKDIIIGKINTGVQLENIGVEGRIILKWFLEKYLVKMIVLDWLIIGPDDWILSL
jgi:hypothetical protein